MQMLEEPCRNCGEWISAPRGSLTWKMTQHYIICKGERPVGPSLRLTAEVRAMNIDKPGNGVLRFEAHPNGGVWITDANGGKYRVNRDALLKAVQNAHAWDKDR